MTAVDIDDDLKRIEEASRALLLLAPEWSAYPKALATRLEADYNSFADCGIQLFVNHVDQPTVIPEFSNWLVSQVPAASVATGAGAILACQSGSIIRYESRAWDWSAREVLDWSNEAFSNADDQCAKP